MRNPVKTPPVCPRPESKSFCRFVALLVLGLLSSVAGPASAIDPAGLFHDYGQFYLRPSEPAAGDLVVVRFQTRHLNATACTLFFRAGGGSVQSQPMTLEDQGLLDCWTASFLMPAQTVEYWFRADNGSDSLYYNAFGPSATSPTGLNFWLAPGFDVPEWAKGISWYQIFPDRFADGNPANNVFTGEYDYYGPVQAKVWGQSPSGANDFFGGDLAGVAAQAGPYLQMQLGVEGIYLNPIFLSPSNHKYDTQDYRQVDPHFGGDAELAELAAVLRDETNQGGDYRVRLMLDGVFNHCGDWHYWFDRAHQWPGVVGAYESKTSAYFGFFTFNAWPNDYVTFGVSFGGHFDAMPKLDYANAALKDEIYAGTDAIARHWLGSPWSIDAWRLDVGQEVGYFGTTNGNHEIWAEFRQAVRAVNPEAMVLGEYWGMALDWLRGDEWDSVMNYNGFLDPVGRWLLKTDMWGNNGPIDTPTFHAWMQGTLADNTGPVRLALLNINGAHDNPRLRFRAGGNLSLVKAATAFLLTYPGAPCIYYGDEVGLTGGADPDNRRTFPWDALSTPPAPELLELNTTLLALRRSKTALRTGSYRELLADETTGSFAFARFDGQGTVLTVVRRKGTSTAPLNLPVWTLGLPDGSVFTDALTGQQFTTAGGGLALTLPGEGFQVLVLAQSAGTTTRFAVAPEREFALQLGSPDGALRSGWARLTPDDPAALPTLVAAQSFRFRTGETETTETILFPAARLVRFRLLVNRQGGNLDAGLAVTNPGTQPARVALRLTSQTGGVYTQTIVVEPGCSVARYVTELFPCLPFEVSGVLDADADQPVAPVQLSVRTNDRGEFLLSALPVVPLAPPTAANDLILNYLAVGGGFTSEIRLTTTATEAVEGAIRFYDPSGAPLELVVKR